MATQLKPNTPLVTHADDLPDAYAMIGQGTCMQPIFNDGACLAFAKDQHPANGDVVIVWFKPEYVRQGGSQCVLKRAVSLPPLDVIGSIAPDSEVVPLVVIEMLNPPKRFAIPATRILAVHKCIGLATPRENGVATVNRRQLSGER